MRRIAIISVILIVVSALAYWLISFINSGPDTPEPPPPSKVVATDEASLKAHIFAACDELTTTTYTRDDCVNNLEQHLLKVTPQKASMAINVCADTASTADYLSDCADDSGPALNLLDMEKAAQLVWSCDDITSTSEYLEDCIEFAAPALVTVTPGHAGRILDWCNKLHSSPEPFIACVVEVPKA